MSDVKFPALEEDCLDCTGSGVVQNPLWANYWRLYAEARSIRADLDLIPEPDENEPEEIRCTACRGSGTVPTPEGLRLLRFVKRHGRTSA